ARRPSAAAALGTPAWPQALGFFTGAGAPPPVRTYADASPRSHSSSAWHATPARLPRWGPRHGRRRSVYSTTGLGLFDHVENVLHRKPSASAFDPPRGDECAAREARAIASRVREGDRFGGSVESHRVRARNVAGARRRHIDGAGEPGLLHGVLQHQRGARRRIVLRRMMHFVHPRAKI